MAPRWSSIAARLVWPHNAARSIALVATKEKVLVTAVSARQIGNGRGHVSLQSSAFRGTPGYGFCCLARGARSPPRHVREGAVQRIDFDCVLFTACTVLSLGRLLGLLLAAPTASPAGRTAARLSFLPFAGLSLLRFRFVDLLYCSLQNVEVCHPHLLRTRPLYLFQLSSLVFCHALKLFLFLLCQ